MTDRGHGVLIELASRALTNVELLKPARRDVAYERAVECLRELVACCRSMDTAPEPLERIATVLEKWDRTGVKQADDNDRRLQEALHRGDHMPYPMPEAVAKGMAEAAAAPVGPILVIEDEEG